MAPWEHNYLVERNLKTYYFNNFSEVKMLQKYNYNDNYLFNARKYDILFY